MRVHWFIFNKGTVPIGVALNHAETTLSDPDGETYGVLAREPIPDRGGYDRYVLPGTKIRWWYGFKTPTVTTTSLKVNLRMAGGYAMDAGMFPPFEIDLSPPNHLGPDPDPLTEFGPEPVRDPQPPAPPQPPIQQPAIPPAPEPVSPPPAPAPIPPEPKLPPVVFEGNASLKPGVGGAVSVTFDSPPEPGDTDIRARIYSNNLKQLRGVLTGRAVETPETRSGVSYVLTAPDGTVFRFSIDGTIMRGTDSNSGNYSLRLIPPPKRPGTPSRTVTRR
jgi:hypothetical protein